MKKLVVVLILLFCGQHFCAGQTEKQDTTAINIAIDQLASFKKSANNADEKASIQRKIIVDAGSKTPANKQIIEDAETALANAVKDSADAYEKVLDAKTLVANLVSANQNIHRVEPTGAEITFFIILLIIVVAVALLARNALKKVEFAFNLKGALSENDYGKITVPTNAFIGLAATIKNTFQDNGDARTKFEAASKEYAVAEDTYNKPESTVDGKKTTEAQKAFDDATKNTMTQLKMPLLCRLPRNK